MTFVSHSSLVDSSAGVSASCAVAAAFSWELGGVVGGWEVQLAAHPSGSLIIQ